MYLQLKITCILCVFRKQVLYCPNNNLILDQFFYHLGFQWGPAFSMRASNWQNLSAISIEYAGDFDWEIASQIYK